MNKTLPQLSPAQKCAFEAAPGYKARMLQTGNTLWNLAEVGLHEYRSAAYLTQLLAQEGFALRQGLAGFPTGFTAQYSTGDGPVVAVLCEYDALPAMSCTAPGENGHGCGHNLFGTAAVYTALSIRDAMRAHGVKGTVRLYGTPGEENFASKVYYVHQGLFDDVDCSVGFHCHHSNKVNFTVSAATTIKSYTFHGKPAHAGNYPWLGNSALDAVEIMNVAANYLREHVTPDVRIQYIITKGGDAPNIVPELAASQYMVRSASVPYMDDVVQRVDNCAHAAALATGCRVDIQQLDKTYNTVLLREYAQLAQSYLELAGPPAFTPDQLEAAKAFGDGSGLRTDIQPLPLVEGYQGGATDEGDVSWVVPHVSIYVANQAYNTTCHTLDYTRQANMPAAYTAMVTQVQATAAMLVGLLENPAQVAELKAAHKAKLNGLCYPKNPDYILPARLNPNCQGVTVEGSIIAADYSLLTLLPQGYAGPLHFLREGREVATLAGTGQTTSSLPLAAGDSLHIYCDTAYGPQLIGYYNL